MVETLRSGWQAKEIPAGMWLSRRTGHVPRAVLALTPEQDRVTLVVDADGPGQDTDQVLGEVFARLSSARRSSVRLVLPSGARRYGPAASRAYGFDIMAVRGPLIITPHGYVLAADPGRLERQEEQQWWRFLPSGDAIPAGILAPSPAWERELSGIPDRVAARVAVYRVQAGLALHPPGESDEMIAAARSVWPDPERVTIVAGGTGVQHDLLHDALAGLLPLLAEGAVPGVRLWWPRAGADAASAALHELARRAGIELIAPSADVSVMAGCCGLCHGAGGVAPWIRFTGSPPGQPMGPLYPVPSWQRALGQADLSGLAPGLIAEQVAAGLAVYRKESDDRGQPQRGLAATARSIIPDPAQASIIAAGDADSPAARQDLEAVLQRLPGEATPSLRIVLSGAGAGGRQSYAQSLADAMGSRISAPTAAWTATPDGRLRAVPDGQRAGAGWQHFSPSGQARRYPAAAPAGPGATASASSATSQSGPPTAAAVPPTATQPTAATITPTTTEQHPPTATQPATAAITPTTTEPAAAVAPTATGPATADIAPGPTAPAAPSGFAGRIVPPKRDPQSLTEDRKLYRESSPEFHRFAVAVRRILSQRPGLRAATADSEEAVLIDFAALLDLLASYRSGQDTGEHPEMWHQARLACAACGLRRLPSFRGAVYYPANLPGDGADAYLSGQIVVEPSFIIATSSPAVSCNGHGHFVIWSETAKRISALEVRSRPDEVIFGSGSSFKVLRVDSAQTAPRILLRELPGRRLGNGPGPAGAPSGDEQWDVMDMRVLDQLGKAAALRDSTPPDRDAVPPWGTAAPPIGLDAPHC